MIWAMEICMWELGLLTLGCCGGCPCKLTCTRAALGWQRVSLCRSQLLRLPCEAEKEMDKGMEMARPGQSKDPVSVSQQPQSLPWGWGCGKCLVLTRG